MANGWLSPIGEFYPCEPMDHNVKAQELEGTDETWVHVYPSGAFTDRPLTEAQIAWLTNSVEDSLNWFYKDMVEWLLEKQA